LVIAFREVANWIGCEERRTGQPQPFLEVERHGPVGAPELKLQLAFSR
jgi:hypothetical protein